MKKIIFCLACLFITTLSFSDSTTPEIKCPEHKPLLTMLGTCTTCDTNEVGISGCDKCPNKQVIDDKCYQTCPAKTPLLTRGGLCETCKTNEDNYSSIFSRKILSGCDKCSNKIMINDICYEKCSGKKPLLLKNGNCVSCDTREVAIFGCSKCKNKLEINGKCYDKCPDDKPVLLENGVCTTCETTEIGIFGCKKCANKEELDGKCYDRCPDNKPLLTEDGKCLPCDTKDTVKYHCDKCSTKQVIDGICYPACPDNKPVLTADFQCKACNNISDEDTVLSGRDKCSAIPETETKAKEIPTAKPATKRYNKRTSGAKFR